MRMHFVIYKFNESFVSAEVFKIFKIFATDYTLLFNLAVFIITI